MNNKVMLMKTKKFSHQSLDSIALYSRANFFADGLTQTPR